jgi:hypothetical protein
MHGGFSDIEQEKIVERFSLADEPVRVGSGALAGDGRVGDPGQDHPLVFQALEPLQGPDVHSVVQARPVRAD